MSRTLVLIIEDEPSIAETVEYALNEEGYSVILAETGRDGLDCFAVRDPGLVILDVGLPDISGFEVCREIRRISDVPVLFLTARESEIDRVVGLEIGADDYVVKPFSPREVTARVKAILRRCSEESNGPGREGKREELSLVVGRISLVPDRLRVSIDETELELSRYEFGLLRVLMEHPGRVYSREQLMEAVWVEPEAALDRTVDAHIKMLRAKFRAADPDFDPIITHRGSGYSLRDER